MRGIFPEPQITLGDVPLRVVDQTRFLGMILDKKLTWVPHIKHLKILCLKSLAILKHLSRISWGADKQALLYLYRTLIRSRLDYACQIYSSAIKSSLKMLDTVHHQGLRLATLAFRTSPIQSLYAETGEHPLSIRRQVLCLQFYCRLQSMPNTPTYATVMNRAHDVLFSTLPYHVPLGPRARGLLERLPVDEL